ncbi:MAG: hypothetical protein LLF76_10970 [Planctomycetaceae bacterium]|nr:hypothetical protein [Planctomycetaceae bacterium]
MQEFLRNRIELVKKLRESDLPVHYADLVLILCSVLCGCAARRWPGKENDRKRFIELLIGWSPERLKTSWISVPSLLNEGLITISQTPYDDFGNSCRIYCDDEIDLSFNEALDKYPMIPPKQLRQHSFAVIIYERLRCGYAHQYWHHNSITHVPASRRGACFSYLSRFSGNQIETRMISIHLEYLITFAEHHVSILSDNPAESPATWWIDE